MASSHEEQIRFANKEIIDNGNAEAVERFFAADYVLHTGGKDYKGIGFVRGFVQQLRAAIPDVRVVNVEFRLQAGETIAWERTLSGTQTGNLRGIPPTGQKVVWRDMLITRFDGEKIAEEWAVSDLAGQLLTKPPLS